MPLCFLIIYGDGLVGQVTDDKSRFPTLSSFGLDLAGKSLNT
tara:strand:+ start:41 stop:166 length:126 start_codon:yes stop_codon:yes gene_type:complete